MLVKWLLRGTRNKILCILWPLKKPHNRDVIRGQKQRGLRGKLGAGWTPQGYLPGFVRVERGPFRLIMLGQAGAPGCPDFLPGVREFIRDIRRLF